MENNFKIFHQLDGSSYKVPADTCRGCWMNENPNKLPKEISPIWQDEDIIIRQDIEWPIPAFFIVSLRKHISSIADLPPEVSAKLFKMITLVRKGMKDVFGTLKYENTSAFLEVASNMTIANTGNVVLSNALSIAKGGTVTIDARSDGSAAISMASTGNGRVILIRLWLVVFLLCMNGQEKCLRLLLALII